MNKIPNKMRLLVTIDKKYLPPLITALDSYGRCHGEYDTDVYVVHSGLDSEDFTLLDNALSDYSINIIGIKITEKWFTGTPVIERLPEESFYRLMAFNYLPKDVDRVLYLDPDIYIRRSLWDLYSMELDDAYLAAAGHFDGFKNKMNMLRLDIDPDKQERYINSGIMLMNIEAIRRDFTIQSILDALTKNISKLLLGDQDLINIIFGEKTVFIDELIYNLDERAYKANKKEFPLSKVEQETAIIHYNGKYKPWLQGYKGVLDKFYPELEQKGPAPYGKWKAQIKAIRNILFASPTQKIIICSVLVMIALCIFSYIFFGRKILNIVADPVLFRNWLDQFGAFDEVIFILIRSAQTVIKFIPAEPLEIGSGYAWGAVPGMIYCVIGNLLGTIVIIFLEKKYGSKVIDFFLPNKKHVLVGLFQNNEKIYLLLFLLYLIPGSPKDGFTYLVGLLPVKVVPFLIITSLARLPSVLSSTLCGSTLADQQYMLSLMIFAATVALALIGAFAYKEYIKRHTK